MSARITFPCPACQQPTRVPAAFAGRGGKCPRCREAVLVPADSQPLSDGEQTQVAAATQACGSCGEQVLAEAKKCRYCGDYFDANLRQRRRGEGNYRLASPWDRMLAYLLDRAVLLFPIPLLWVAIAPLAPSDEAMALAFLGATAWFLLVCGFQWFLMASHGTTLGKRWRKLLIVRDDGRPVDFLHGVLLRSWIPICLIVGGSLFYVIGCAFVVVDKLFILADDRRCLHDHLASTIVVEEGRWGFKGVALPETSGEPPLLR
jgi:uncharacterized RDD family membrane protein YckC